jgi:hypothetical protein
MALATQNRSRCSLQSDNYANISPTTKKIAKAVSTNTQDSVLYNFST